jgi:hypothetical protein
MTLNVGLSPHIFDDTKTPGIDLAFSGHLRALQVAAPVSSARGVNVTSVTPFGDDSTGGFVIVMAGALAANTRICTITWAIAFTTIPRVRLTDETSAAGLAIINPYLLAQVAGISFDLAADQALAAGTYKIGYTVFG